MRFELIFALIFAVICTPQVFAQGENEVKRGTYPHMAFIYYLDDTIMDANGVRFLQSAFLIRPDWLVTSSIEVNNHNYNVARFPTKTLLARVGAVTVDSKFTLSEDEDEQEQEIIQVVRPYNHNATVWWRTDISLLKTLLPFNITLSVNGAYFNLKRKPSNKFCFILNYIKEPSNFSDDKVLKRTSVELQIPSTKETCGPRFEKTMICAIENEENKNNTIQDFCLGNSGGPLMCNNEVVGVQTYAEPNCKPPYLYQLLSEWENFISCGTDDNCQDEKCSKECVSFHKDPDSRRSATNLKTRDEDDKNTVKIVENITTTSARPEIITEEGEIEMTPTLTTEESTTTDTTTQKTITTTTEKTTEKTSSIKTDEIKESAIGKRRNDEKKSEQNDKDTKKKPSVEPQKADKVVKLSGGAQRNSGLQLMLFKFIFWYFISI